MADRMRAGLRLVASNGRRVAQPVTRALPIQPHDKWALVWAKIEQLRTSGRGSK